MPRLLVFSDIHNDVKGLARLMETEADYYVAAGDLVTFGKGLDQMAAPMLAKADRIWVLPGNHESESDVERFCAANGFHNFHGRTFEAGAMHIAGLGYSSPTPFDTPGEYSEAEIARRLKKFAGLKPMVLICHCPPLQTPLDRVKEGLHAGSSAVREFIEREQPEHFFCGHIHEAEGVVHQMGATRGMNVGRAGFLLGW